LATDTHDVLFLNKLLKKQCPNVQVFTTGPSIILANPEDAYHMRGMIVASTYPLYPPNQNWVQGKFSRRLSFLGQSAQGTYNAVLAQLGGAPLLEYRAPQFADATPQCKDWPPIWISMVSENGKFVPLHCYRNYDDTCPTSPRYSYVFVGPDS